MSKQLYNRCAQVISYTVVHQRDLITLTFNVIQLIQSFKDISKAQENIAVLNRYNIIYFRNKYLCN